MSSERNGRFKSHAGFGIAAFLVLVGTAITLLSCSSNRSVTPLKGMGTIIVSMTDPASCAVPTGNFEHVYVTINSVQANMNSDATDGSGGWQELAPQLNSQPMQIDLLSQPATTCLLANLGSNDSLPAGTYQQIRLILVPNSGGNGPVPTANACGSMGFNCVVLADGSVDELNLSSQANTGLKIPPGQIVGGPITVADGQTVDLNIDFNTCASIIEQGNGQFRLKPTLTAEQVSPNRTGISGNVVVSGTTNPIVGGTALVAVEQPDSGGIDRILEQAAADSNGNFDFCPLPANATFDVVADAVNGSGVAYNPTIAVGIPGGQKLSNIPLFAEIGPSGTGPGAIQGAITALGGSIDTALSALQTISFQLSSGSVTRELTVPLEGTSTQNVSVASTTGCPAGAPAGADCASYTLFVPASNASVGVFNSGTLAFSIPAAGNPNYTVEGQAFAPTSMGTPTCSPTSESVNQTLGGEPLGVPPSPAVTAATLNFTGCQ